MSRLGAKTYSRKPECRTSIQFDTLLTDKSNKPSTAKVSVAGIHRWGMTSFTSLRKSRVNGQKEAPESHESAKRVKLETKTSTCSNDPFNFNTDNDISTVDHTPIVNALSHSVTETETKPAAPKPNKFFKSGGSRSLGRGRSTSDTNSAKSDFDALRLSIPNCNMGKSSEDQHNYLTNIHSSLRDEEPHSSDKHSMFYTNDSPNVVDLRFPINVTDTCASTEFRNDSKHLDIPFMQSTRYSNSSSQAFDNLRTLNFPSNKQLNIERISTANFESAEYISKELKCNSINNDLAVIEENLDTTSNIYNRMALDKDAMEDYENNCITEDNDEDEIEELFSTKLDDIESIIPSQLSSINTSDDRDVSSSFLPSQDKDETQTTAAKQLSRPKKIFSSSLKPKAVYNHRHWHSSKKEAEEGPENQPKPSSLADEFEETNKEAFTEAFIDKNSDVPSEVLQPFACVKNSKQLYTVVRNVKQAYQCHESGETQEFNDDIEYLLECVQECNGIGTRCLSILNLAAKCMGPAFRIHLRAHGTMPKIFSALKDAPTDPNLALCTSTLMFVLSQDRLTMDIEASTLSLMLQLLETDPEMRCPEKEFDLILKDPALCAMQDKHREKVYQLCEEMQQKGHAKHLKLNNINTGILAMETLLSLTSRKAGEWFKEEMRTLHGLDHITDTVTSCVALLIPEEDEIIAHPNETQFDRIRKIDRCLRVLENVTYMNYENQEYLMSYKNSSLIISCLSLMKLCKSHLLEKQSSDQDITTETSSQPFEGNDFSILSCLLSLLKVLINLTHENSLNDTHTASDGLMENVLMCILQVPRAVSAEKRFDLLVLSLGLFINLVEYCMENRVKFMEMYAIGSYDSVNDGYEMLASEAVIELMFSRLELARLSEEQADALLSTQEEKHAASVEKKDIESAAEDLEETLMKTLQKAGKHMEHSIVAAYIAILLGCVIQNNKAFADVLKDQVPDGKFDVMVDVLKKFMSFVSLSGSVGNRGVKSIQRVIQVLESS